MNDVIQFSREVAVKAIGSVWYLDKDKNALVENLGKSIPPTVFSNITYPTFEEAITHHDLPVEALPDVIKMPAGTVIAAKSRSVPHFIQSVVLMNYQDILNRGLYLEEVPVSRVEYDTAPSHLSSKYDLVAIYAYAQLKDGTTLQIHIEYDPSGYALITDVPMVSRQAGWMPLEQVSAYLDRDAAETAADMMARHLIKSVDWKANSL